ncbi:hypothetical protein K439DRAFT_1623783 [Ramaria rubella]|nr:hypothetical protein K439DRAFT_1623783 [Ramaria rubella]
MSTELAAQDVLAAIANSGVTMQHGTHWDTIVDDGVTVRDVPHHADAFSLSPQRHSAPRPSTTTQTIHNHLDSPHPPHGTLKRSPNLLGLRVSHTVACCDIRTPQQWHTTEWGRPGLDGPLPQPTQWTCQQGGCMSVALTYTLGLVKIHSVNRHRQVAAPLRPVPAPSCPLLSPPPLSPLNAPHALRVAHNVAITLASCRLLAPPLSPSHPPHRPSRLQATSIALQ